MKVIVCIKQSVSGEINPFDACAYEAALQIEGAEVTIVSMGPPKSLEFLRGLTRLGAKRAVLLSDSAFAGADTLATSYALSLAIKKLGAELVICGRQTVDGDTGQVGPELAQTCNMALLANAMKIDAGEGAVTVTNREGKIMSAEYPALITVERINTLRLPSIRSRVGEVETLTASMLGADLDRCGLRGSPTRVIKSFENQKDRRKCEFIDTSRLKEVINLSLKKERADIKSAVSEKKLSRVWIVGDKPRAMAQTVSDDIKLVDIDMPENMAKLISCEKPEAVLWASDVESRLTAARVAAILGLGLCADCTSLETDGEVLFMYRPAFSGNVIAKIRSNTKPAMATVRTSTGGDRIAIGVGMGAREHLDKMSAWAQELGARTVATRLMVDNDYFPYPSQVGLTGAAISPDVYIAVGISGAVHHIAGINTSGTIIAINSDKNASIFDYADYGIVADIKDVEL